MKKAFALIIIAFFLIAWSGQANAGVYRKCPDCTIFYQGSFYHSELCPSPLCSDDPQNDIPLRNIDHLIANWTKPSLLSGGTSNIHINFANISVTMYTDGGAFEASMYIYDCSSPGGNALLEEIFIIGSDVVTHRWDITDFFRECDDEIRVKLVPNKMGGGSGFLVVTDMDLIVNYVEYGHLSATINSETDLTRDEPFDVTSVINCYGGFCDTVYGILEYSGGGGFAWDPVPWGSGNDDAPFIIDPPSYNQQICNEQIPIEGSDPACELTWTVIPEMTGEYLLRVNASSYSPHVEDGISRELGVTVNEPLPSIGELEVSIPYIGLPLDHTAGLLNDFNMESQIYCVGGECGNVIATLEYSEDNVVFHTMPVFQDCTGASNEPLFIRGFGSPSENNPYECGQIDLGSGYPCSPYWWIQTLDSGNYWLRIKAESDLEGVQDKYSDSVPVHVVDVLFVGDVYFNDTQIEVGDTVMLTAEVECLENYYCPEVQLFAKNNSITIADNGFDIIGSNPRDFYFLYPVQTESWDLQINVEGIYDQISVAARYKECSHIYTSEEWAETLIVNPPPSPEFGYLDFQEDADYFSPNQIDVGQSATMWGEVSCEGPGTCGPVTVYAQHQGENIPPSEGPLTTPDSFRDCGEMDPGDPPCPIEWEITGNDAGEYHNIHMYAISGLGEVQPATSYPSHDLIVNVPQAPLGDIIVTGFVEPEEIFVDEYTNVSGTVMCSNEYCGELTVTLEYTNGSLVETTGDLATTDNPIFCQYPPCYPLWDVLGNKEGLYEIKITVNSNESIYSETDDMPVFVSQPDEPPVPTLHISDVNNVSELVNTNFMVSTKVSCFSADCGSTDVYLQYLDGSQWITLSASTPLSTATNTKTYNLNSGQSQNAEWTVTPSHAGTYEMRISADSQLAGQEHSYFQAQITPPDVLAMEVQKPEDSQKFSRGDSLPLQVRITLNDVPKDGLYPSALFMDSLSDNMTLPGSGDGIYSSSVPIPKTAEGDYMITYKINGEEDSVIVSVDPSLAVTLNTDKYSYETMDSMVISGDVKKRGFPTEANVHVEFICGSWKHGFDLGSGTDGEFHDIHDLPQDIPNGSCTLRATATDDHENTGSDSTEVNIIESEFDVYDLVFVSPEEGQSFESGSEMTIAVDVFHEQDPVTSAIVNCRSASGKDFDIKLNNDGSGRYSRTLNATRKSGENTWQIRCMARTSDELFGSGFVNIIVNPRIEIVIKEPTVDEVVKGDTIHFVIDVLYSDFGFVEDGNVSMVIDNETIWLNYTGWGGRYETFYTAEEEGILSFSLSAEDDFGNLKFKSIEIAAVFYPEVNTLGAMLIIAGGAILGSLGVAYRAKKGKTVVKTVTKTVVKGPDRKTTIGNKIKDLEKESKAIEKAKEDAEMKYYHREINEKEFKKMMENYEEHLLKIKAEIQEHGKELKTLK